MKRNHVRLIDPRMLLLLVMTCAVGCDPDRRYAEFVDESVERQAEQTQEMARLNREVAASYQELTELQHDMQAEQAEIGHQRDELESDREELAEAREREPIIASVISTIGMLLACLLPLLIVLALLAGQDDADPDEALGELLTLELVADHPRLLRPGDPSKSTACLPHNPTADAGDDDADAS